jgi:DtxR family Mn-dependent transcriptional regulator
MAEGRSGLSRSVEDYLKGIYALCETGEVASTNAIAEALDVQPASVTGMVKRLAESGLLEHVPYRGVALTDEGTREALRILRRHRIIETYLTEKLAYPWEDVHREAERLEHAASDELIERMAARLEHPKHDPHGAPIPTSAGEIEATDSFTLGELGLNIEAQIRAIRDDDAEGLRAAETAGLLPGTRVRVVSKDRAGALLGVEVGIPDGTISDISLDLAHRVYVVSVGERFTGQDRS